VSFALQAGELAFVRTSRQGRFPPLAELAEGLSAPAEGRVLFLGEDWTLLDADQAARRRGQIGRVFQGPAWVNNLDVDENVTLRVRHYSGLPAPEVNAAAADIAGRVGLSEVPRTRPAWTPHEDLARAQWVRALLGQPRLLVLEDPERDAPESAIAAWRVAVAVALRDGAAVLWIGPESPGDPAPRQCFEIRGPEMVRMEETKL
jgi:predicted ABC-type transport system involved in lysophospholipase L1 biosynthesis ATPase subunit